MGRTRAAHLGPDRRRPQVLDAALELAVEHGIRAVSMEAVAQHLGVTKPVVYACFSSRWALLSALLTREEERLAGGLLSVLPTVVDLSQAEKIIVDGYQALMSVVEQHSSSWQLIFASQAEPEVAERYQRLRQDVLERIISRLRPGLLAWQIDDLERKLPIMAEIIVAIGDAAVRSMLRAQWPAQELGAFVARILSAGLRQI